MHGKLLKRLVGDREGCVSTSTMRLTIPSHAKNPMSTMLTPAQIVDTVDRLDYSGFAVQSDYIDANGHMNVGYYTLLFDKALDLPWAALGLYSAILLQTGRSTFALECHLTYQRELVLGDPLKFGFRLLDYDAKRVHYFMQMYHATEQYLAATCEQLSICMDMKTRRSTA